MVRRARWPWVVAATVVLGGAGATAAVVLGRGSRSQAPPIAPAPPSPPGAAAPVHGELLTAAEGFAVVLPAGYVGQPTSSGLVAAGPDGDNLSCGQVRAGVPYTPDALVGWLIGSSTATLPAVTGTATRRSIGGVDRPVALFGDARARAEVVFYEAPGQTFYCAAGTTPARFDAQAPLRAELFARRVVVPTVAPTAVRPGWPPTQQQAAMPGATVDVDAVIAATLAEQRRLAADLVVAYVMANDVEPDGVIRAERGQLALQLHSPAHAADAVCGVTTMAGRGTGVVRAPLTADCHVAPPPPPRCGMAALWRKARASGEIPATATTADIMWAADGAARREWFFMAGGEAVYLRDDC